MTTGPYATVADMAERYNLSAETIRSYVRTAHWPADRVGPRRLIRFSPEQQDQVRAQTAAARTGQRRSDRRLEAIRQLAS